MAGTQYAMRTECQVLSPAAFMDFRYEVNRRLQSGVATQARVLWESVVEIRHAGSVPMAVVGGFPELPELRWAPCTTVDCRRCAERRGGFQFPWLGFWCRRGVVVAVGTNPAQAWEGYHASAERFSADVLPRLASALDRDQICPDHLWRLLARLEEGRDGVTISDFVQLFQAHQAGERIFREPWSAYEPQWGLQHGQAGQQRYSVVAGGSGRGLGLYPTPLSLVFGPHCQRVSHLRSCLLQRMPGMLDPLFGV